MDDCWNCWILIEENFLSSKRLFSIFLNQDGNLIELSSESLLRVARFFKAFSKRAQNEKIWINFFFIFEFLYFQSAFSMNEIPRILNVFQVDLRKWTLRIPFVWELKRKVFAWSNSAEFSVKLNNETKHKSYLGAFSQAPL